MKKTAIFALCAALLAMVSCKKDNTTANIQAGEPVKVQFALGGNDSKATAASAKESTVNNFQIFVFNTDGTLDAAGYQNSNANLTLECSTGAKMVYAIVNHSSDITTSIANEAALKAVKSNLSDNAVTTGFVMFGSKNATIEAGATVTVPVDRICSKVYIDKITNNLNDALGKITLNGVYVINATGDATFGDETYTTAASGTWYNKRAQAASGNTAVEAMLTETGLNTDIVKGTPYATAHYFYVYPNGTSTDSSDETWSARYSRLVIDVTVENDVDAAGAAIAHRYYPINLVVEAGEEYGAASAATAFMPLGRNKYYHITNLKINKLGSLDPDKPIVSEDIEFNVSVNTWGLGFEKEVEY